MTTNHRFILALLALGSAIVARAETAIARQAQNRAASPILAILDTNRDGRLSAREIAAAPLTLAALDLDEDGIISPEELRARNAEGQIVRVWHGATATNIVFTLDANNDGDLQSLEIANAVSSLRRLDRNGDGELTPSELRPVMLARN